MSIVVVSTAFNAPTEQLCRASVAAQTTRAPHDYINAARQTCPMPASANLYQAVNALDPGTVVVWLDGDDWLATRHALDTVAHAHEAMGALVTYGQYMRADGRPGHCAEHDWSVPVRQQPWRASHLRTFRAGLFQRLTPADLQCDGEWIERCVDLAVMWPLIEMAGPKRTLFIPEVLCVYNDASSWEAHATPADMAEQSSVEIDLRMREPKEMLP